MLDLSSRKVYGALAEQCVGGDVKADKVENATSGHLAGLDSNGNLTDSGVSPTEDVTVEGNPITFESPFEQDAKSVVVSVKPIQDLHGLPFPYVGGAYKNKLPLVLADIKAANTSGTWNGNVYTLNGITFDVLTDNDNNVTGIKLNGTATDNSQLFLVTSAYVENMYVGQILSGITNGNGYFLNFNYSNDGINWAGETDVTSGEKTILDYPYIQPSIFVRPNAVADNTILYPMLRLATESDATFAPYSNICPISGIDEVEIEVSDGKSEPTTTTIPLTQTVYDADVDVTEGAGTDAMGFVDLGDLTYEYAYGIFEARINDLKLTLGKSCDLLCSAYPKSDARYNLLPDFSISSNVQDWAQTARILIKNSNYTDAAAFKTAMSGHQLCYELSTPTTISFTPADVELLEGTNVVSTNGEKVAVTYGRSLWQDIDKLKTDTEGKLNKSDVADVEGDTASRPYSVNDFMLRADGFYKVTAPIAQNASITASNTTKTTVGEVLTALLNA